MDEFSRAKSMVKFLDKVLPEIRQPEHREGLVFVRNHCIDVCNSIANDNITYEPGTYEHSVYIHEKHLHVRLHRKESAAIQRNICEILHKEGRYFSPEECAEAKGWDCFNGES